MPIFQGKKQEEPKTIEQWVAQTYLHGVNALHDLRENSRKWYDNVAGDMIPKDVSEALKEKGLPALPLNIILPKVLRVIGAERATRAGIKAVPLSRGKNDTAKALTQIFDMIRVNSDGHREIRRAFEDAIISDLGGWLEVVWTNDNDPLGQPIYRRINPFYVVWDMKAQRSDLSDTRWILKTWFATRDDIIRDFPEKAKDIKNVLEEMQHQNSWQYIQDWWESARGAQESKDSEFFDRKENLYRLIECQKREEVREIRLFDAETQTVERPEDKEELETLKAQYPRLLEVEFKQDRIRVITTVAGEKLLLQDVDADVQNNMFSLIPIWGYTFGDKNFGIVKNLEAPQELFWKETSSALHIVNAAANPIWMIPKDSMTPQQTEDLKKYGARTGYQLEYDPMAAGGHLPQRVSLEVAGIGHLNLADRAKFIADDVSGIGPNAVGQADTGNESGELVQTRISETLAMIENLFDNKMAAQVLLHQYLIALIKTKMTGMRILRYIGDDRNPQQLIINQMTVHGILNDMKEGEYGIAIEKGQAQYFREEKFVKLVALAKLVGPMPELVQMVIETFDDIDESEKERLINAYKIQTMIPELASLEQEMRGNAAQNSQTMLAEKTGNREQVDKQLDAIEKQTQERKAA